MSDERTPEQIWDAACVYIVRQARMQGPEMALAHAAHPSRYNPYREKNAIVKTETYHRRSFDVEAVRVTAENMADVAKWCGGTVDIPIGALTTTKERVIHVEVAKAIRPRQTQAHIGDWVLSYNDGFKVFSNSSFRRDFCVGSTNVIDIRS